MGKGKSGVSKEAAKKAYKKANDDIEALASHIEKLKEDIQDLNRDLWYGGKLANKWYSEMNTRFDNLVLFDNQLAQFQTALYNVFKKSSAKGIFD